MDQSRSRLSLIALSLSVNFQIPSIESLSKRTVHVEPPVADEVVLVEDGPVGAEEAVLGKAPLTIVSTDMECLALGLSISIVTPIHLK